MTEELKPCPFCGGKPLAYDMLESLSICTVECSGCDITVEGRTTQAAATRWNTRALTAAQPAQAAQVPEERKLVPVEPTVEMALAGADVIRNRARGKFVRYVMHDVWAAMLAAAPQGAEQAKGVR